MRSLVAPFAWVLSSLAAWSRHGKCMHCHEKLSQALDRQFKTYELLDARHDELLELVQIAETPELLAYRKKLEEKRTRCLRRLNAIRHVAGLVAISDKEAQLAEILAGDE